MVMKSLAVLLHASLNVSHLSLSVQHTHSYFSHSYLLGYRLTGYRVGITEPVLTEPSGNILTQACMARTPLFRHAGIVSPHTPTGER